MTGLAFQARNASPPPPPEPSEPRRRASAAPLASPAVLARDVEDAFGRRMAAAFNLPAAPTLTTSTLKRAQMAVTRLTSAGPAAGFTAPLATERAYLVTLQLREVAAGALWIGGSSVHAGVLPEGSISIVHLEDEPIYHFSHPFDCLQFHIPEILFEELAATHGTPAISGLVFQADIVDRVVQQLGAALLPSLATPGPCGRTFFDHIALAVYSHLASAHGRRGERRAQMVSGLTAAQARKAKALLAEELTRDPPIAEVSAACGLTPGRFIRAFRQTTGMPPHRWLRHFRVERAKELLFDSRLSLAQIAYDCGFSDQSHFTRVFTSAIGLTPGAWRRQRRG